MNANVFYTYFKSDINLIKKVTILINFIIEYMDKQQNIDPNHQSYISKLAQSLNQGNYDLIPNIQVQTLNSLVNYFQLSMESNPNLIYSLKLQIEKRKIWGNIQKIQSENQKILKRFDEIQAKSHNLQLYLNRNNNIKISKYQFGQNSCIKLLIILTLIINFLGCLAVWMSDYTSFIIYAIVAFVCALASFIIQFKIIGQDIGLNEFMIQRQEITEKKQKK